ncbi:hypothetical protein SH668x_003712 [Planctomicrobium sp. SH668]|jgi:hypothetical protein|uniref:hypothetical protein n=1 Tax=Planctomicrobium sp. SH668 TaxID=3448126 RepID=UPI003F5BED76|nr:hypothetical protein [Planctomycetaceae bacterium]
MNRKLSLSQLIEIFTAFAGITLLAVIAEREEPGGDQHLISLGIVLVLLMIHAASECISDFFTRPKPLEEMDTQDKKGNDQ